MMVDSKNTMKSAKKSSEGFTKNFSHNSLKYNSGHGPK